ncbi:hypothetical protein LWI29_004627 [Acer saccharum]|uniref:GOLD domain-containing protein n=1 Tax=Acer saccharum TaxID=4024 RepID=A0AA39RNW1_ACESA|nr:hypothetical protein LWI29_004627 [Acer saccharum]
MNNMLMQRYGFSSVIKGTSGEQIHDFHDKTSEKYEFFVQKRGVYQIRFTNKSPYHETIDFDIYVVTSLNLSNGLLCYYFWLII